MACIFCGQQTIEHAPILAEWQRRMAADAAPQAFVVARKETNGQSSYWWRQQRARTLIQDVCDGCRGGWMSEIEDDTVSVLEPLLVDALRARVLLPDAQRRLARWAMKTVLMLDFAFPAGRLIPDSWYPDFFAKRQAPESGVWIWSAACNAPKNGVQVFRVPLIIEVRAMPHDSEADLRIETRGFLMTFVMLQAVFQVLGYSATDGISVCDGSPHTVKILRRLWPDTGIPAIWPPSGGILNDSMLMKFAGRRDFTEFGRIDTSGWAPTIASYQFPEPAP